MIVWEFPRKKFKTEVKALFEIAQEAYSSPFSWSEKEFLNHFAQNQSYFFVIFVEDKIVGFLEVKRVLEEAEIIDIAILPRYQHRGMAQELLQVGLQEMRKSGVIKVFLEVRESNERARSLYRSLGFQAISLRKNYYSYPKEDAVVMRLHMGKE